MAQRAWNILNDWYILIDLIDSLVNNFPYAYSIHQIQLLVPLSI